MKKKKTLYDILPSNIETQSKNKISEKNVS